MNWYTGKLPTIRSDDFFLSFSKQSLIIPLYSLEQMYCKFSFFCIFHGQWHPQFGKIYIDLFNLVSASLTLFCKWTNDVQRSEKVGRARIGSASAKDGIPGLDQLQLWLFPVSPLFPLYPKLLIALPHCCPSPHSNNNLLSSYKNGCFSVALFRLTTLNISKYS